MDILPTLESSLESLCATSQVQSKKAFEQLEVSFERVHGVFASSERPFCRIVGVMLESWPQWKRDESPGSILLKASSAGWR
jgi:hypothetical protein